MPKQAAILDAAARLVKPGGGLVYATCSVLPAENERQIEAFVERHPEFAVVPVADVGMPPETSRSGPYLRLSPLQAWHRRLLRRGADRARDAAKAARRRASDRDHTDGNFDDLDRPDDGDECRPDPPRPED